MFEKEPHNYCLQTFIKIIFIAVQPLYNAMSVSAAQQSELAIYIYIYICICPIFGFPSQLCHQNRLSRLHGAIQQVLINYLCYKIPWRRKQQPNQYSCLESPMAGGSWQATVHGLAAKSWTRLSKFTFISPSYIAVYIFSIQSTGFSRPEYWSGQPFPSPGDLSNPGIEPRSLALQADSLAAEPQGKPRRREKSSK